MKKKKLRSIPVSDVDYLKVLDEYYKSSEGVLTSFERYGKDMLLFNPGLFNWASPELEEYDLELTDDEIISLMRSKLTGIRSRMWEYLLRLPLSRRVLVSNVNAIRTMLRSERFGGKIDFLNEHYRKELGDSDLSEIHALRHLVTWEEAVELYNYSNIFDIYEIYRFNSRTHLNLFEFLNRRIKCGRTIDEDDLVTKVDMLIDMMSNDFYRKQMEKYKELEDYMNTLPGLVLLIAQKL